MPYRDVVILIPCHSLEDFPSDQGDAAAAPLLNAFAVAWHPQLLATTGQLPHWHRADDPPEPSSGLLAIIPSASNGWLPHNWPQRARAVEAVVLEDLSTREELSAAALAPLSPADIDPELVADFFALGTSWLLTELLTRHMRNFGNIDEVRLQNRAVGAARAVIAGDRETAVAHLKSAFEILLEARERFYPVDCYLIDLCLATAELLDDAFLTRLQQQTPLNLLIAPADLAAACEKRPAIVEPLRSAVAEGRVCVIGGEDRETNTPVMPMASFLASLQFGGQQSEALLGRRPVIWGRRRFGLSPVLPGLLARWGMRGAMHVVLDDGIYPDHEYTRFRWRSPDQTMLDAWSRIPLAADSAASYLRFPARMAESMDNDHVAGLALARWPDVSAPWFHDLQRTQQYAPCLGKFVTLEQLFSVTSSPGKLCEYAAREYFTPFLIQHVARRDPDPLSRYARHAMRRRRFDAAEWCRTVVAALTGRTLASSTALDVEQAVEAAAVDRTSSQPADDVEAKLSSFEASATAEFAQIIAGSGQPGMLLINPLAFARRATVRLPLRSPPSVSGAVKAVESDSDHAERCIVTVDVPGCGFVWVPVDGRAALPKETPRKAPPAEPWVLRNERLEVTLNDKTGGIAEVRHPHKRENRFSQLLSYRFSRERTLPGDDDRHPVKTFYAETQCQSCETISATGAFVEMATTGEIVDQTQHECLARFRQVVRLVRGKPIVEIEIELSDVKLPDGDPWNNYFCSRFAWDDSTAAVTRSLLDGAHGFGGERFETTAYIEVASESERLTIIPHGLPFHRKTGARMVDALLLVAGETQRRFQFTVALDHSYPLEAARDAVHPLPIVPALGPPRSGESGWLFHLDARNVQLERLLDIQDWREETADAAEPLRVLERGFAVRLMETEGRARPVRLRCYRQPVRARKRDFLGGTVRELPIEGDAVMMDLAEYEVVDVELRFADSWAG